jgi:hypothetical protein
MQSWGVSEQGAEKIIWPEKVLSDTRLEKAA